MVYRRTAETFYWPAMRDNAALTAECPGQNESSEYTRDAYAGNVFPCVLYLFLPLFFFSLFFFVVLPFCGRAWNIGCSNQRHRTTVKERRAEDSREQEETSLFRGSCYCRHIVVNVNRVNARTHENE